MSSALLLFTACGPPTLDVAPLKPAVPPVEPYGNLMIDSQPPATDIFIDGLHVDGITPLTISLVAKNHTIGLHRTFYKNFDITVTVMPNGLNQLKATLTSSLYPYTGSWQQKEFNILPTGQNVSISLELYVEDDKIFGKDLILIDDLGGSANCAGTIDPATNNVDMLCTFMSMVDNYWRTSRYKISPHADSEISVSTLYIDSVSRLFLGGTLVRK